MTYIVKRGGKTELYAPKKHRASITKSLRSVHVKSSDISIMADEILASCEQWLSRRPEVAVKDLRARTAKELTKHSKDAAIVYKMYPDIW